MKRTKVGIIAAILLLGGFWPSLARGYLITIEIEAVVDGVDDPDGYLEGQVNPGSIITGSYTYDSATPDFDPLDYAGLYEHATHPYGISLSVAGFEFRTDPVNVDFDLAVLNNYPPSLRDQFWIASYNNLPLPGGAHVETISWQLDDVTGTALSSPEILTGPPVLEDWESVFGLEVHIEKSLIRAHVTSAELVPEPATLVLLAAGGIIAIRKRK